MVAGDIHHIIYRVHADKRQTLLEPVGTLGHLGSAKRYTAVAGNTVGSLYVDRYPLSEGLSDRE